MKGLKLLKNSGPGALAAAAFFGPGTVTICSMAGAQYGFSLLWALLLSILATMVLQEMSARLGLISKKGLAEAIRTSIRNKIVRSFIVLLMISAIIIGNSAYQAGNISGGILGLSSFIPLWELDAFGNVYNLWPLAIGAIAFMFLYLGNYKILERMLIVFVIIMSLSFLIAALLTNPDWSQILKGSFVPQFPDGSLFMIIGLIGTTVVPYNLFLHASLVQEKWNSPSDLPSLRKDSRRSILLGGLVSMSIIITAAAIPNPNISSMTELAVGLKPIYGASAGYFLGIGLFAAGISSALTAPLAAAYVAQGCFGWEKDLKNRKSRMIWSLVLISGVVFAIIGKSPLEIIKFAQISNGLLLPIVALLLIWIMNKKNLMGEFVNSRFQNILGSIIIFIVIGLSVKMFYTLFFK